MKSIVYITNGARPYRPVLVDHDPRFPAFEIFRNDPRWCGRLGLHYFGWRYKGTIMGSMSIHEKINHRAEFISETTWHIWHRKPLPPGQYGRKWGRDYQWYVTPERIARSRFRKAKRDDRTGRKHGYGARGYATMDFSFGLHSGCGNNFNSWEREVMHQRLTLASTSRAPLPPWSLNSAVDELLLKRAA
jgi:hypothetical protein